MFTKNAILATAGIFTLTLAPASFAADAATPAQAPAPTYTAAPPAPIATPPADVVPYGLNANPPQSPPPSAAALRPTKEPLRDPKEIALEKDLNALFDDIDKDRNGQINEVEYSAYYKTITTDTTFGSYNLDNDGGISRAEFVAQNTVNGHIVMPDK